MGIIGNSPIGSNLFLIFTEYVDSIKQQQILQIPRKRRNFYI